MKRLQYLDLSCIVVMMTEFIHFACGCGGYIDALEADIIQGDLLSPRISTHSTDHTAINSTHTANHKQVHCIWLIEGPPNYAFNFTIKSLSLHQDANCKRDFLEVRAGSRYEPILFSSCNDSYAWSMHTPYQWLWVRLKAADYPVSFTGTWHKIYSPVNYEPLSPVPVCSAVRYDCANKECISMAWTCDGYNDCGCDNCDEDWCGGLSIDTFTGTMIGFACGVVLFFASLVMAIRYDYGMCKCKNLSLTSCNFRQRNHTKYTGCATQIQVGTQIYPEAIGVMSLEDNTI